MPAANAPPTPTPAPSRSPCYSCSYVRALSSAAYFGDGGGGFSYPSPRALGDVVKLNLLRREDPERVKAIWLEKHKDEPMRHGSNLERDEYRALERRSKTCPFFVVPVPKEQGYISLVTQVQGKSIFMTYLEEYRKNPAIARPWLVISLYPELLEMVYARHKVLVRTDVCTPQLTKEEAARATRVLLTYYVDDNRFRFVEQFNLRPDEFDFNTYLADCMTLS